MFRRTSMMGGVTGDSGWEKRSVLFKSVDLAAL
jgi:hypothetical protein